jgi:NADH dehydrogenase/NADH:ubiquinone oxidoreductase subunit G
MGNPLFRDYERLVNITVLGKAFPVPEKNTCLRAFQYMSPETIPYGRFCWNQECQLCRVSYTMASQPDAPPRTVLACKVLVAEGMQITELSDELRYNLMGVIRPPQPRPAYDEEAGASDGRAGDS